MASTSSVKVTVRLKEVAVQRHLIFQVAAYKLSNTFESAVSSTCLNVLLSEVGEVGEFNSEMAQSNYAVIDSFPGLPTVQFF